MKFILVVGVVRWGITSPEGNRCLELNSDESTTLAVFKAHFAYYLLHEVFPNTSGYK